MPFVTNYPTWTYYPTRSRPPDWVHAFVAVVAAAREDIGSARISGLTSNKVLAYLEPGLTKLGYTVELSSSRDHSIRRPVLFGENGVAQLTYHVDAVHDGLGVLVEVEAGRGARGNAVYRDLVRASLIVDARYLVLGVMQEYRHQSSQKTISVQSYREARKQLEAIYASGRLHLPFDGVLLFGY
jgi:hypothetical protein